MRGVIIEDKSIYKNRFHDFGGVVTIQDLTSWPVNDHYAPRRQADRNGERPLADSRYRPLVAFLGSFLVGGLKAMGS